MYKNENINHPFIFLSAKGWLDEWMDLLEAATPRYYKDFVILNQTKISLIRMTEFHYSPKYKLSRSPNFLVAAVLRLG